MLASLRGTNQGPEAYRLAHLLCGLTQSAQRAGFFYWHCCNGVTEHAHRSWHSGRACGPCGLRTPAAVPRPAARTASYAIHICQYKCGLGADLETTEPVRLDGLCCFGVLEQKRHARPSHAAIKFGTVVLVLGSGSP
jgi:hypothetical protein